MKFVVDERSQDSLEAYYRRFEEEEQPFGEGGGDGYVGPLHRRHRDWLPKADIVFDQFHVVRLVQRGRGQSASPGA